ncbi:hypothetical protein GOP47_0028206 [Adiantum capillus-veneris]|nr:hypothetical protein GOP47_0028206 [Adiantum capillus-veneris]
MACVRKCIFVYAQARQARRQAYWTSSMLAEGAERRSKDLTVIAMKQQQITSRQELVKEQIILSQERKIYGLTQLVKTLQQKLGKCHGATRQNKTDTTTTTHLEIMKIDGDSSHL